MIHRMLVIAITVAAFTVAPVAIASAGTDPKAPATCPASVPGLSPFNPVGWLLAPITGVVLGAGGAFSAVLNGKLPIMLPVGGLPPRATD